MLDELGRIANIRAILVLRRDWRMPVLERLDDQLARCPNSSTTSSGYGFFPPFSPLGLQHHRHRQ